MNIFEYEETKPKRPPIHAIQTIFLARSGADPVIRNLCKYILALEGIINRDKRGVSRYLRTLKAKNLELRKTIDAMKGQV